MSGFFTSLFGGGNKRKPTTPPNTRVPIGSTAPRTDNRKRTPNATETGRKAVPRPDPLVPVTPAIPPIAGLIPDPMTAAHQAAARQRRKGRTMRASALLGRAGPSSAPVLNKRTLIGS